MGSSYLWKLPLLASYQHRNEIAGTVVAIAGTWGRSTPASQDRFGPQTMAMSDLVLWFSLSVLGSMFECLVSSVSASGGALPVSRSSFQDQSQRPKDRRSLSEDAYYFICLPSNG